MFICPFKKNSTRKDKEDSSSEWKSSGQSVRPCVPFKKKPGSSQDWQQIEQGRRFIWTEKINWPIQHVIFFYLLNKYLIYFFSVLSSFFNLQQQSRTVTKYKISELFLLYFHAAGINSPLIVIMMVLLVVTSLSIWEQEVWWNRLLCTYMFKKNKKQKSSWHVWHCRHSK